MTFQMRVTMVFHELIPNSTADDGDLWLPKGVLSLQGTLRSRDNRGRLYDTMVYGASGATEEEAKALAPKVVEHFKEQLLAALVGAVAIEWRMTPDLALQKPVRKNDGWRIQMRARYSVHTDLLFTPVSQEEFTAQLEKEGV